MSTFPFKHLLLLEPLGLLYGSSGRMLSPESLTGRVSEHFPPDSPTLAGLIGSQLERVSGAKKEDSPIRHLHTAGPFCFDTKANNLWLPAPFTLLQQETGEGEPSLRQLQWQRGDLEGGAGSWQPLDGAPMPRKYRRGGWVALRHWHQLRGGGEPTTASATRSG